MPNTKRWIIAVILLFTSCLKSDPVLLGLGRDLVAGAVELPSFGCSKEGGRDVLQEKPNVKH